MSDSTPSSPTHRSHATPARAALRRSVSARNLGPSVPAGAITPIASPGATPTASTRPRTRHFAAQERLLAEAAQHVASSRQAPVDTDVLAQAASDTLAQVEDEDVFHPPAASSPEASLSHTASQPTPDTPTLYDLPLLPDLLSGESFVPSGTATSAVATATTTQELDPAAFPGSQLLSAASSPASIDPFSPLNTTSFGFTPLPAFMSVRTPYSGASVPAPLTTGASSIPSSLYHFPVTDVAATTNISTATPSISAVASPPVAPTPASQSTFTYSASPSASIPLQHSTGVPASPIIMPTTIAGTQAQQSALLRQLVGASQPAYPYSAPAFQQPGASMQDIIAATAQAAVQHAMASLPQASRNPAQMHAITPVSVPDYQPTRQRSRAMDTQAPTTSAPARALSSLRIGNSSGPPTVQLGHSASFTLPLPPVLDPNPQELDWYKWEPKVRAFFESIDFPDIMDVPPLTSGRAYSTADHAQCIRFLLEMIPDVDADYFITERKTYNTVYVIWSQLVKEYGRHAQARVHALIRSFDGATQSPGETIGDYVTRVSRLVKTLKTCQVPPNELSHKLKLLNVLPVLPGSDIQHKHFLGTLHTKLDTLSIPELEQELIDHESAIHRQQDTDILASRLTADAATKLFATDAGSSLRLRPVLARPPRGRTPQCIICFNMASEKLQKHYKSHGTRSCGHYNSPEGQAVRRWLDRTARDAGTRNGDRDAGKHNAKRNGAPKRPNKPDPAPETK